MNNYLVFIPAYNEASTIGQIIGQIHQLREDPDILVIDDGSGDSTRDILEKTSGIYTLYHQANLGYGQTLIDGFNFAGEKGYEYVITIDSDKQHQPSEIPLFIEQSKQLGVDILSGSRYLHPSGEGLMKAPADRVKVNRRITARINQITGYRLTDAFCGFKLYRVKALNRLNLNEQGYGMPLQFWIQAWKKGLTLRELPVQMIYFDHDPTVRASHSNLCQRYKYYLDVIEKEKMTYETTDISRSS